MGLGKLCFLHCAFPNILLTTRGRRIDVAAASAPPPAGRAVLNRPCGHDSVTHPSWRGQPADADSRRAWKGRPMTTRQKRRPGPDHTITIDATRGELWCPWTAASSRHGQWLTWREASIDGAVHPARRCRHVAAGATDMPDNAPKVDSAYYSIPSAARGRRTRRSMRRSYPAVAAIWDHSPLYRRSTQSRSGRKPSR